MKLKIFAAAVAVGSIVAVSSASAATLWINDGSADIARIDFTDTNNNSKLDLAEFTSWQNFLTPFVSNFFADLTLISNTAQIATVAVPGGTVCSGFASGFCFTNSFGDTSSVFAIFGTDVLRVEGGGQPPVAVVPVPASLPLLAAGLFGLGFMARRKRKSA